MFINSNFSEVISVTFGADRVKESQGQTIGSSLTVSLSPPAEARLRCSLWRREECLEERRLEAEETLEGLRHRVDQLDSLLASPDLVT